MHTRRYLAPEVIFGAFTPKADVYSYGMLMYAVLHRRQPFDTLTAFGVLAMVSFHQSRPEVDVPAVLAPVAEVMTRCWDVSKEERPTMSAVVEELTDNIREHTRVVDGLQ